MIGNKEVSQPETLTKTIMSLQEIFPPVFNSVKPRRQFWTVVAQLPLCCRATYWGRIGWLFGRWNNLTAERLHVVDSPVSHRRHIMTRWVFRQVFCIWLCFLIWWCVPTKLNCFYKKSLYQSDYALISVEENNLLVLTEGALVLSCLCLHMNLCMTQKHHKSSSSSGSIKLMISLPLMVANISPRKTHQIGDGICLCVLVPTSPGNPHRRRVPVAPHPISLIMPSLSFWHKMEMSYELLLWLTCGCSQMRMSLSTTESPHPLSSTVMSFSCGHTVLKQGIVQYYSICLECNTVGKCFYWNLSETHQDSSICACVAIMAKHDTLQQVDWSLLRRKWN